MGDPIPPDKFTLRQRPGLRFIHSKSLLIGEGTVNKNPETFFPGHRKA